MTAHSAFDEQDKSELTQSTARFRSSDETHGVTWAITCSFYNPVLWANFLLALGLSPLTRQSCWLEPLSGSGAEQCVLSLWLSTLLVAALPRRCNPHPPRAITSRGSTALALPACGNEDLTVEKHLWPRRAPCQSVWTERTWTRGEKFHMKTWSSAKTFWQMPFSPLWNAVIFDTVDPEGCLLSHWKSRFCISSPT